MKWLEKLKEKFMLGKSYAPPPPAYAQLGASNMAVSNSLASQQAAYMQSHYAAAQTPPQASMPAPDMWAMNIEKTEDGYVLHVSKNNQRVKKFIAKDVEELKTKFVSSMVLSQLDKG